MVAVGEIWEQVFTNSQGMPESCSPQRIVIHLQQLLKHTLASQREMLMVPSGKELLNIISISVFLSTCQEQVRGKNMPIAYGNTRIPLSSL